LENIVRDLSGWYVLLDLELSAEPGPVTISREMWPFSWCSGAIAATAYDFTSDFFMLGDVLQSLLRTSVIFTRTSKEDILTGYEMVTLLKSRQSMSQILASPFIQSV
jgi:hypothetical protein